MLIPLAAYLSWNMKQISGGTRVGVHKIFTCSFCAVSRVNPNTNGEIITCGNEAMYVFYFVDIVHKMKVILSTVETS